MTRKIITNEEKEAYLSSIKKMIWSIIHSFNNIPLQEKEDIFQETCVFITEKLIYKYDPKKNVAFKDFSYICIKNFVCRKINNMNKRNKVLLVNDEVVSIQTENLEDERIGNKQLDKVVAIKKLLDSNSPLLKENEKTVLRMIFENPNITQKEMSNRMGFSFASGVGAILSRLRKRIEAENLLDNYMPDDEV